MIRNPNDIQEGAKKIRMLIAGYPGIGKSTLALSAPNPLHIGVRLRYRPHRAALPQAVHPAPELRRDPGRPAPSIFRTSIRWFSIPAAS